MATHNILGKIDNSSSVTGDIDMTLNLFGTSAASMTVSGILRFTAVNVREQHVYRRLVAVGNDILYYEAI